MMTGGENSKPEAVGAPAPQKKGASNEREAASEEETEASGEGPQERGPGRGRKNGLTETTSPPLHKVR